MSARLFLCASIAVIAACAEDQRTPRSSSVRGDGGTAPLADAGARVATECLDPALCVTTDDCPTGTHCNHSLSPPQCQRLYCGEENSACSEEGHCKTGHRCWNAEICLVCSECSTYCAPLSVDPNNCGSCGTVVGSNEACVGGRPVCQPGTTDCSGTCIDLSRDVENCGACGRACEQACSSGRCLAPVHGSFRSCAIACGAHELDCPSAPLFLGTEEEGVGIATYAGNAASELLTLVTCADEAPPMHAGLPFAGSTCVCFERE